MNEAVKRTSQFKATTIVRAATDLTETLPMNGKIFFDAEELMGSASHF